MEERAGDEFGVGEAMEKLSSVMSRKGIMQLLWAPGKT